MWESKLSKAKKSVIYYGICYMYIFLYCGNITSQEQDNFYMFVLCLLVCLSKLVQSYRLIPNKYKRKTKLLLKVDFLIRVDLTINYITVFLRQQ